MFKKFLALILATLMLCSVVACKKPGGSDEAIKDTALELKVKVFKMGRASCIILRTGNKVVMIDTGDEEKYDKVVTYLNEKEIKRIDTLIITSFSKKNIGGISAVLGAAEVGEVYMPGYTKSSGTYLTFENALTNAGITPKTVNEKTRVEVADTILDICPSAKSYSTATDVNDEANSLVIDLHHGSTRMLLTSKINGERLTEVAEMFKDAKFDLVTVPNYGEFDEKLEAFFKAFKTEYSVVVTSGTNPLPAETKAAMEAAGIDTGKLYDTINGAIEISTSGAGITEIKN